MKICDLIEGKQWTLDGCWVLPDGEVLWVNHDKNIHHSKLALEHFYSDITATYGEADFDDELDMDALYDEAFIMAQQNQWIRISVDAAESIKSVAIQVYYGISKEALRSIRDIFLDFEASGYKFELYGPNSSEPRSTDNAKVIMGWLKRGFYEG